MPSLQAMRRDLALKAATCQLITTGVLYGSTYQGVGSGSDAARQVISSDLGHASLSGTSAEIPTTAYDYQWTYRVLSAEQRRVVKNGYSGYNLASDVLTGQNSGANSFVVGYLTNDRAYATSVAPNETIERLGRFPVFATEDVPGLHWAITEALQVLHWPRQESVTGNGTHRIDVASSLPWLKRPEQLIRVFDVTPSSGEPQVMPGKAWLEPDGEKQWLHIPRAVTSGSAFTIQVRRPCHTWVLVKRQARATVTVTAGAITALTLVDGGLGYSGTATVSFSGAGSGASATVTVSNGSVTGFSGLVGGSGWVQATTFATISAPDTTTWTTSTVGPVNELDEALPEVDRVTAVAYWMLCRRMARRGPKPQQQEWQAEEKLAAAEAAPFVEWQNEAPSPYTGPRVPLHPNGKAWRPAVFAGRRWP